MNTQILQLQKTALELKSITLSTRQLCDIELILDDSFAPLNGFINQSDYNSVLKDMRLINGNLWPIPICLDLNEEQIQNIKNLYLQVG